MTILSALLQRLNISWPLKRRALEKWDAYRFEPCEDISARELAAVLMKTSTDFGGTLNKLILFPEGVTPEDIIGIAGINRHYLRDTKEDQWVTAGSIKTSAQS